MSNGWEDAPSSNGGWEDAPGGESSSGGYNYVKDQAETLYNSIKGMGSRATDPETYKKALQMALDELTKTGANLVSGGKTTPSASEEAAVNLGTGFVGFGAGLAAGPLTPREGESAEDRINSISQRLTYQPQTEAGKDVSESYGKLINDVGIPLMGHMAHPEPNIPRIREALNKRIKTDPALEQIKAKQAEIDAAKAAAEQQKPPQYTPPVDLREELGMAPDQQPQGIPATRTSMLEGSPENADLLSGARERMADQLKRGEDLGKDAAGDQLWTEARVADMHDKLLQERLSNLNDQLNHGEDKQALTEKYNQQYADEQLRRRQEQMEQDVGRQTSLDFNAAERARQEKAPMAGIEELKARQAEEQRAVQKQAEELEAARQRQEISAAEFQKELSDLAGKVEQMRAQHQIEMRQQQMEEQVARQRSLDFNAQERARQDAAPVPGIDPVLRQASEASAQNPLLQAARERLSNVEERAVNSGDQGPLHQKFMEESLRLKEQQVEGLKNEIESTVRKNPMGLPGNKIRVPLKQRGAIGRDISGKGKQRTIVDDLKDRFGKGAESNDSFIPEDPNPKDTLKEAKAEGKDGKGSNLFASGAILEAAKRGSALIRDVARTIQNHAKKADLLIRQNVFPVEKALRSLSPKEVTRLEAVLLDEMRQGKRYDAAALDALTKKEFEAYQHIRHMFEDTLRIQNEARVARGQEPITEMEAYASSRWDGDYRRPVYKARLDKNGNPIINEKGEIEKQLAWYLADHTKGGLEKQWKKLQADHPDLMYDPKLDHTVRQYKRQTDLQSVYSTIIDILGRDDPAVQKLKQAVEDQATNEAASFLGQEKHFKTKQGIRGFVGDRPGKAGSFKESLAFFQQQIQYGKNAYNWSEMQKAGQALKEVFSDKDLATQQPNNMKYAKEYFKNHVGFGEHVAIAHMEDSLKDFGVNMHMVDKTIGGTKSFFLLQKLGVNAGYSLAGLLQSSNVLPYTFRLYQQGFVGNPVTSLASSIAGGLALGSGHYASLFTGGKLSGGIGKDSAFFKKAFKYAEDNGVTARSLMDESPIESSFSTVGKAAKLVGDTMSVPEVYGRSMAYMYFVEFLRSSGKFKGDDIGLFQKAEELVNQSMVDYRAGERPMVFTKLGTAGNFLNTLQTYPMNWYNQWNLFARDLMHGNPMPVMAAFAVQYAMAGMMGIPGFQDMDKLYQLVKDHVVSNETYAKMRDSDFWNDPKVWMLKNWGNDAVNGWVSDKSGIGLTSRAAAPGLSDMVQAPGGPALDIGKQVYQAGKAAVTRDGDDAAQAAMSSIPPGLQGLLEQAPFMQGKTWDQHIDPATGKPDGRRVYQRPGNIADHRGIVTRTPQEETLRNFGLRSERETVERELGYRADHDQRVGVSRANDMMNDMYAASKKGDEGRVRELVGAYIKLTGQAPSDAAWEQQILQNYTTSFERAGVGLEKKPVTAIKDYARMKAIMDKVKREYERAGTN